jgi:hypothetical protein
MVDAHPGACRWRIIPRGIAGWVHKSPKPEALPNKFLDTIFKEKCSSMVVVRSSAERRLAVYEPSQGEDKS